MNFGAVGEFVSENVVLITSPLPLGRLECWRGPLCEGRWRASNDQCAAAMATPHLSRSHASR